MSRSHHARLRSISRPLVIGAAAALVLAGTSVATASGAARGSAAAVVPTALPAQSASGLVLLKTGATNQVLFDSNGDGIADTYPAQSLGNVAKACNLSTDGSILGIAGANSASTNAAGLLSGSIGVVDVKTDRSGSESSGKSCGLVDAPSQSLTLTVGTAIAADHPVYASALLDVELKGNAQIQAIAYRGTTPVGLYELRSGKTTTTPVGTTPPAGYTGPNVIFTCLEGKADSAPDAGVASNCRWPISSPSWADTNNNGVNDSTGDDGVYFDKLVLQAVNGAFSLEGGADTGVVAGSPTLDSGLPQTASFFEVPGPLTNCGDPALTISGTGTTPNATVKRIDNTDGPGTCQPLAVTLSNGPNTLTISKSSTAQTTAQFIVSVTWSFPVPVGGGFPPGFHHTQIDWQQGAGFQEVPFCTFGTFTGGVLTGVSPAITAAQDAVPDAQLPGIQYACWATSNWLPDAANNSLTITEQIYLLGDPMMRG